MSCIEELSIELENLDEEEFSENYLDHDRYEEIYSRIVIENNENRRSVTNAIKSVNKGFLEDTWEGHVDDVMMDGICNIIKNDVVDITQVLYRINFLDEIIRCKIESGCNVTSVRIPIYIILSQCISRIYYVNFGDLEKYSELQSDFKYLLIHYEGMSASEKVVFMLVTAVMFGALLNVKELLKFSNMSYIDVQNNDGIYWVDIPCDNGKCSITQVRKFYLNFVTLQIIRLNLIGGIGGVNQNVAWGFGEKITEKNLSVCIRNIFKKDKKSKTNTYKNVAQLLGVLKTQYSHSLPSNVLDFATGRNISYSLMLRASERFIHGKVISRKKEPIKKRKLSNKVKREILPNPTQFHVSYNEDEIILKISNLIKNDRFDDLKVLLYSDKTISKPILYLARWCIALRNGIAPNRGENKAYSVLRSYKYLSWVFPVFFNIDDIVCMDIDEVSDRYNRILEYSIIQYTEEIDGIDDEQKKLILLNSKLFKENNNDTFEDADYIDGIINRQSLISKELKTFHQFLVSEYSVEKIIFESLDGFVSLRHSVKANIIMPNEYIKILDSLWPTKCASDRQGYINYLIFIFGYRLGLRRNEILQLRLCDLLGDYFIYLNVLINEYGVVKSPSAIRQLPLYDLLTDDECFDLINWVEVRRGEVKGRIGSSLLFTNTSFISSKINDLDKLLTINSTYDVIHRVMRDVTGDNDLTFHCLRHSFVSWHLLLQEAERIPSIIDERIHAFKNTDNINIYPREFKTLLNYDEGSGKVLYQLCVLAGHSTPFITLLHYCHFMDWILHNWMLRSIPSFSIKEISVLLGLKESSVYTKLGDINKNEDGEYNLQDCIHLSKKSVLKSI